MKKKNLIIFMPSIEGGGVEKNLYIISNYLVNKIYDISLITVTKSAKSIPVTPASILRMKRS